MADTETTNYRSGINLHFGDSATTAADKTVNYMEEYLYFDKVISDRKVVYIRSSLDITCDHNARNRAGKADGSRAYETVSTSQGQIIYKVDGDGRFGMAPEDGDWANYSVPFSFDDLNYAIYGDAGVAVVGTTGDNGDTRDLANRLTYYYRGILDSVGDEWHTLTMADDDTGYGSIATDFSASDGKIWYFVVNPKTPCMTVRATGDGEFYTTPPKKYMIPKIYDQTTYFNSGTGTVTFEIHDLYGGNVFYRIVSDPNDAVTSYTDAGADNITLDQDDFSDGTQYLQYYYNASYKKTRMVVKNPAYPSAGEDHGNRFWLNNPDNWTNDIAPRLTSYPTDNSDAHWLESWSDTDFWSQETTVLASARTGDRWRLDGTTAQKAILARYYGWTATRSGGSTTYADLAKLTLFELGTNIDPVGMEIGQNFDAIPSRELFYRGYWDFLPMINNAVGYDLLIAGYRRSSYSGGISAIEDYFIRDALARYVHWSSLEVAYYTNESTPGMWDTARRIGAAWIAAAMPSYNTEYFGTCGIDGTTTTTVDNPFPSVAYTWEELFLTHDYTVTAYPNPAKTMGVETYQCTSAGDFNDRIPYSDTTLQGAALQAYWLILAQYAPNTSIPYSLLAMDEAAAGTLNGTVFTTGDPGPPGTGDYADTFRAWAAIQNSWYTDFRDVAKPAMLAIPNGTSAAEAQDRQGRFFQPFVQLYWDSSFVSSSPSAPAPASVGLSAITLL